MKRIFIFLSMLLLLTGAVCAAAESAPVHDAEWSLPETIGMTEGIRAVFEHAISDLTGVDYEPVGFLGEKDGVYCVLCRATVVYPDAKPYYALVYVNDSGIQNIWEIWMDAHSRP